jgi:3-oxoadipate enol-lactonase
MNAVVVNGVRIAYRIDGSDDPGRPWIVFSHSLACDHRMWDPQVEAFSDFRLLRYDTRGHGASDAPAGDYTLELLAEDLKVLLEALGIARCHLVGLSMGGMIGQQFALRYPARLTSLTLADTTSRQPPEARSVWDERLALVRTKGMDAIVPSTLERWFTASFRGRAADAMAKIGAMIRATPVAGYAGCAYAIARIDLSSRLSNIDCPVLVMVGEHDPGTPREMSEQIVRAIAAARLEVIADAAHLSNVEQSDRFNTLLRQFLTSSS